jgi:hypothetical protein
MLTRTYCRGARESDSRADRSSHGTIGFRILRIIHRRKTKVQRMKVNSVLHRLTISPQGSLGLVATASEVDAPVQPNEIAPEIVTAFHKSIADGLTTIASSRWQSAVMGWPD